MLLPFRFFVGLSGSVEGRVVFDVGEFGEKVRKHEGVRVVRVQVTPSQLGKVGIVLALLDGEEQFLLEFDERRLAVGVLVKFELGLVRDLAHFGILHHAQEGFVAGVAEFEFEKCAAGFLALAGVEQFLRLRGQPGAEHRLLADQLLNERFEAIELMSGNGRRSADDEWCSGLVDEDRVHFVHDGKKVAALDLLFPAGGHAVVAEIVESELAVRAVSDVALILGAAIFRRLVVLNDADR